MSRSNLRASAIKASRKKKGKFFEIPAKIYAKNFCNLSNAKFRTLVSIIFTASCANQLLLGSFYSFVGILRMLKSLKWIVFNFNYHLQKIRHGLIC